MVLQTSLILVSLTTFTANNLTLGAVAVANMLCCRIVKPENLITVTADIFSKDVFKKRPSELNDGLCCPAELVPRDPGINKTNMI